MVRTVRVRLELDRDDYRRGLRDAASDTRTFDGEVKAAGKDLDAMGVEVKAAGTKVEAAGKQADTAAKSTKGLGEEVDKAKQKTTGLGEETRKTKEETSRFGDESTKTKGRIVDLATEITKTKTALADLGEEFRRTGQVNLGELNRLSSGLRELERAKATIGKLLPDNNNGGFGSTIAAIGTFLADLGRLGPATLNAGGSLLDAAKNIIRKIGSGVADASKSLFNSIGTGLKNGVTAIGGAIRDGVSSGLQSAADWAKKNPWLAAAIAAGITVGMPLIGAAITGAIGAGWIAGGIALAAHDPAVSSAWGDLAHSAVGQLSSAASVFVDPLVKGAGIFGDTLGRIMPTVRADMAMMAPYATQLIGGVAGFVEKLMPGIDALTRQAGPVLHVLAQEAPQLGSALSQAFAFIAQGAPGGAAALHDILKVVEFLIKSVGIAIMGFEHFYLELRAVGQALSGHWNDAKKSMKEAGDWSFKAGQDAKNASGGVQTLGNALDKASLGAQLSADDFSKLSGQINATRTDSGALAAMMSDKLLNSMMSMDQATLGFAQAQTQLTDSIKQNGLQLDIHTAKGQANRQAILAAVQANIRQYDAMIQSGAGADEAAAAYDANTKSLESQLRQAGWTQGAIDGLIGKYRHVPANVDTDIAMNGLTAAIGNLDNLLRRLNGLPTVKTIRINEITYHYESPSNFFHGLAKGGIRAYAKGGIDYAAASGILAPSNPGTILAAEPQTGGEALIPKLGISQARAMMLASEVGRWHGFTVVPNRAPNYASFAGMRPVGGGNTTVINVNVNAGMVADGPALQRQIGAVMREYVRSNGGNVQVVLGRS